MQEPTGGASVRTTDPVPPLPYEYSALQPWISEASLRLHHDYHRARVEVLNAAQARLREARGGSDFGWIRYLQQQVALRASEDRLHRLFWEIMGPNQGGAPSDGLADQIHEDFGSFATFKSQFCAVAMAPERGEWVALVCQSTSGRLGIRTVDYQQFPCEWDTAVLLALDLSEHAYYLQYDNRRAEYVYNWWNTVNWPRVAERFAVATQLGNAIADTGAPRRRRKDHHALAPGIDGWTRFPGRADERRGR